MNKRRRVLRAVLISLVFAMLFLVAALGAFVGVFGWHRFLLDFWPLDASRVGPNLVASIVVFVLVIWHNEARRIGIDESKGKTLRQIEHDVVDEFLRPLTEEEQP